MADAAAYKRWPGWLAMALRARRPAGRSASPRPASRRPPTSGCRAIAERLACPVCQRRERRRVPRPPSADRSGRTSSELVAEGQLTDAEIVAQIESTYAEDLRARPRRLGVRCPDLGAPVDGRRRAAPPVSWLAFARWRRRPGGRRAPTRRATARLVDGGPARRDDPGDRASEPDRLAELEEERRLPAAFAHRSRPRTRGRRRRRRRLPDPARRLHGAAPRRPAGDRPRSGRAAVAASAQSPSVSLGVLAGLLVTALLVWLLKTSAEDEDPTRGARR